MAISPVGKKKIMVAQMESNQNWGLQSEDMQNPMQTPPSARAEKSGNGTNLPPDESKELGVNDGIPNDQEPALEEHQGGEDITNYIFQKLEGFGYPPRRLEDFSSEFVTEKIYSGGIKEVAVVIPDSYYGSRNKVSDHDFTKIIDEIQQKFKLHFTDGERKDKKITLNFTSQKPIDNTATEDQGSGDNLDEVYGKRGNSQEKKQQPNSPIKSNVKVKKVQASTLNEMLAENKDSMIEALKILLSGKNNV
jgi:hypothetical protein